MNKQSKVNLLHSKLEYHNGILHKTCILLLSVFNCCSWYLWRHAYQQNGSITTASENISTPNTNCLWIFAVSEIPFLDRPTGPFRHECEITLQITANIRLTNSWKQCSYTNLSQNVVHSCFSNTYWYRKS